MIDEKRRACWRKRTDVHAGRTDAHMLDGQMRMLEESDRRACIDAWWRDACGQVAGMQEVIHVYIYI